LKGIRILVLMLWACFVSAAWSQQPACQGCNNWSEFHRPNMHRWNPYEDVLSVNNVGSLSLKWSYTTGSWVDSSPAVVDGVLYIGSADGNLYALNANTGARLWRYTTGDEVFSSPAVVNGVVYFGSQGYHVYALNAETGALLWSCETSHWVSSSPAVADAMA
jgi:outer membrane protein assembly factor BamB